MALPAGMRCPYSSAMHSPTKVILAAHFVFNSLSIGGVARANGKGDYEIRDDIRHTIVVDSAGTGDLYGHKYLLGGTCEFERV